MKYNIEVRVTSVRVQNPLGFGGCIFSAKPVTSLGEASDATTNLVVKASGFILKGAAVQTGQWWRVSGKAETTILRVNGYAIKETQIEAESIELIQPSGEYIVNFIAQGEAFPGIGPVKARKLWTALGADLYRALDEGDRKALGEVLVFPQLVTVLLEGWVQYGQSKLLQWLQTQGFPQVIGKKVVQFFGSDAPNKIEADPYRLLSFCARWSDVDSLARGHFKVAEDDPRRLQGAIEEACYRVFAGGHTTALSSTLQAHLLSVLKSGKTGLHRSPLVAKALNEGFAAGTFVRGVHGVQPLGAHVMESEVAQAVASRVASDVPAPLATADVNQLLGEYEQQEGLMLNLEQRAAVCLAMTSPFLIITGGAGVGKTTVLKAIYKAYDAASIRVTQLALAGRAAKRMMEATGRPASTIASFLRDHPENLDGQDVIVVDEASMVDIITMSALCHAIGEQSRLLLVGDPAQLMPVGPGLVLHALVKVRQIPIAELKVVKRYGGLIASAAQSIRNGHWPDLPHKRGQAMTFLRASKDEITDMVVELYKEGPSDTQILSARRTGPDGTHELNARCQALANSEGGLILMRMPKYEGIVHLGFRVGDQLLCTRNLYDHGLQNGSLGTIVRSTTPQAVSEDVPGGDTPLAWVRWDDEIERPLLPSMLDDVELGYAITVHKAQGSQWPRIVVPLSGHKLLDRTLVYTAITRAQREVILVGDEAAVSEAVHRPPRAHTRCVSLDLILSAILGRKEIQQADR